jgi:competence protein ComEA
MFVNQIRGLIVILLFLAIIPFIIFFNNLFLSAKIPILVNQYNDSITVAIQNTDVGESIFFTAPATSANKLLELSGFNWRSSPDFMLENGMKLIITPGKAEKVSWTRIDNTSRLALGMPIDLNTATADDLLLIPGIGEKTAQNILTLRNRKVRFRDIEELMEIDGIKEKKLAKLKQYLYLQKKQEAIY